MVNIVCVSLDAPKDGLFSVSKSSLPHSIEMMNHQSI